MDYYLWKIDWFSREKLQENPIEIMGTSGWFPVKIFPFLSTH